MGRAWKHACSQRFLFSKGKLLDEEGKEQANSFENPVAHIVNVKYEKNKVTKNDRRFGSYTLNYFTGIDVFSDTIELGLYLELIRQSGAWFFVHDSNGEEQKFQGKAKLVSWLSDNQEEFEVIKNRIMEQAVM